MMPPSIVITIGELELEGISPAGRFDVARGFQLELSRLLAESGMPRGLLAGEAGGAPIVNPAGLAPIDLGRAVARAVYEGWR